MRFAIELGAALVLIMLIGAGTAGCQDQAPEPFAIAWNFDTSGYLETCGCSSHQLGGIARRATLLARLRERQPVLAIEGAHIMEEAGDYQLFKGETIVRGLNMMDYSAMQLGVREAQQGAVGILALSELADFPLFSANLIVKDKPWPVRYAIVEMAGVKVGITGISQPELVSFELEAGISFASPEDDLSQLLDELAEETDITVVCLEGEQGWITTMSQLHARQADLFLSGDRREVSASLAFSSDPPLLNNWKLGKYLGLVMVDPVEDGFMFAGQNLDLGSDVTDNIEVADMLDNDYRAQLKDRFFGILKVDLEAIHLPPEYCKDCHPEAYDSYLASGHSKALTSLYDKGQLYNPDCMRCHVSYDPDNDELVAMNCVTCHTNITEDHVWMALEDPQQIARPDPPVASYTQVFCYQCHDELNSANFKGHWPNYVERIYHGGDKQEALAAAEQLGLNLDGVIPDH